MSHPGMLSITALGKMRGHEKLNIGFSGKTPQTFNFLKNKNACEINYKLFLNIIRNLDNPIISKKGNRINQLYWENINANVICEFINGYITDQPTINSEVLNGYIKQQNKKQKLIEWDLAIRGTSDKFTPKQKLDVIQEKLTINGEEYKIGRPYRALAEIGDYLETPGRSNAILDKSARMIGLGITDPKTKEDLIKQKRAELGKPLLVLYPLDPREIDPDSSIPIIGFGLIFPTITNEAKIEYATRPVEDLLIEPHVNDDNDEEEK